MPILHKNISTEADIHNPKWFIGADNGDVSWKNEQGNLESTDELVLPAALNFVDASIAPPTTNSGDIYVLSSGGSVNAGWGSVSLGDWVRYDGTDWNSITPQKSTLCYDKTNDVLMSFNGSNWGQVGSDSIYTSSGTSISSLSITMTDSITMTTGDAATTGLRIVSGHTRNGFGENDILFSIRDISSDDVFTVGGSDSLSIETSIQTKDNLVFYGSEYFSLFNVRAFTIDEDTVPVYGHSGVRMRCTSGFYLNEDTWIDKVASQEFILSNTGTNLDKFKSINDFADVTEQTTRGFWSGDEAERFLVFDETGRIRIKAVDSTTPDSFLVASEMSFRLDESGNQLTFKVKYSDGTTVKSGSIALT
jgi:hypothetical protein